MQHWRRPTTISTSLFLLLFILLATFNTNIVRADDDDTAGDEYEETARVARVSLINGDVQLRRDGSQEWESVRVNLPLVEGDELATTGQDARLEIQIDARNFVRVGGDSILRVVTLRDEGVALSLLEGTAILRLARFDRDKEYFEIDAPGTTLAAEKQGVYRLDVSRAGSVRLIVRDGGQARIYSETSGFTLRDGRSAELVNGGTDAGDWELSRASSFDSWDTWVDERERYLAERLRYDDRDRYYDRDVWGAEELDAYGDWTYANNDYGWVWRPRVTVINNYNNWAPYRYGQWSWVQPYGWTWVGDEPWGWAPYHYGRWVYHNNSWCWAPRGYGYKYKRAWWRPALVVFVYIPTRSGEHVAWYPLSHGQRDPRGRHFGRFDRRGSPDRLRRIHPEYHRAITTLPARQFGRRGSRGQPAPTDIAQRALASEPVRGRLPIAPADSTGQSAGETGRRVPRIFGARPGTSTGDSAPAWRNRPIGAARRTPGVALDGELRRTRLFRGREPRGASGARENNSAGIFNRIDSGDTGAVARPTRRRMRPTDGQPAERGTPRDNSNSGTPSLERPAWPPRNSGDERRQWPRPSPNAEPRTDGGNTESAPPAPRERRRRDDNDGGENEGRPARRREPRPEPQPQTGTEPQPEPRREPRPERRPERRPEPRPEQVPESRPEPRPERRPDPSPESRPEPRPEPPPQREEQRPAAPRRERNDDDDAPRPSRRNENSGLRAKTPPAETPN